MAKSNLWKEPLFKALTPNAKLLFIFISDHRDKEGYFTIDREAIKEALKPFTEAEIKATFKELKHMYICTPDRKKLSLIALNEVGLLPLGDDLKQRRKKFVKPTIEEIQLIIKDKKLSQKFFNHYEANGWRTNKNPLVNWTAAANNWVLNNEEKTQPQKIQQKTAIVF